MLIFSIPVPELLIAYAPGAARFFSLPFDVGWIDCLPGEQVFPTVGEPKPRERRRNFVCQQVYTNRRRRHTRLPSRLVIQRNVYKASAHFDSQEMKSAHVKR